METITLEQAYYIVEIIGVTVVVASLIYVGKQLQLNVESLQANQRQTTTAMDLQSLYKSIDNPSRVLARYKPELTDEEKIQVFYSLVAYLRVRELDWIQYQNGVLDKTTWTTYQLSIKIVLSSPNNKIVWQNCSLLLDPAFVAHINELIADIPTTERPLALTIFD